MKKFRHICLCATAALVVLLAMQTASTGEYRQFPGVPTDSRTLKIQERVEAIFSSGDYGRALLIYEKELAPRGDKYAQYMVGFMHLTGKGVRKNPAEALAWYRLAAERGQGPLMEARDALRESLQPAGLERADARFAELWQSYGDRKLLLELVSSDLDILRRGAPADGPPVENAAPGPSLATGYAGTGIIDGYYRRVRERLRERLQYLSSTRDAAAAGIENPAAMEKLETRVRQELRALELPQATLP